MVDHKTLLNAFRAIVGSDRVSDNEVVLSSYSMDTSTPYGVAGNPDVVLLPNTVGEVQRVLEVANKHCIPVVPLARGTNIAGSCIPRDGGIVMDLRLMDRIIEINTDASYAVIEPGVTFHLLINELGKRGFRCHIPTASGGASPLANYLMRPSGNLAAKWDPDPIIALEVVLPNGEILRTGSAAFAGGTWQSRYGPFPDLTGLFCCSYGTLGVITKAAVKIYERCEDQRLLLAAFNDFNAAVKYMKRLARANLADSTTFWSWGWCMFHDVMLSKKRELPAEMLKEDQRTPPHGHPYGIATTLLSGYREVLDAQEKVCDRLAKGFGGRAMTSEEARELYPGSWAYWNAYFKQGTFMVPGEEAQLRLGLHLPGCLVTARPTCIVEVESMMWKIAVKEFKPPVFFRALPFNYAREFFLAFVIYITGSLIEEGKYLKHLGHIYSTLYDELLEKYGAVMFRFRRDPMYVVKTGTYALLLKRMKKIIDPNNIMNPGIRLFEREEP
jgi:FAD/FMN-containing dehydrogenase